VVATSCKEEPAQPAPDFSYLGSGVNTIKYEYAKKKKKSEKTPEEKKDETLDIATIDSIIQKHKMANLLKTRANIKPDEAESFKWYKLFNYGLVWIKYRMA